MIKHDVFISYASEDYGVAEKICNVLESEAIGCWIAPRDITPGENYAEAIVRALDESKTIILVFSSYANSSPHIIREVERGVHNNSIIVPFIIDNTTPNLSFEYFMRSAQWLDATTPPLDIHIKRLVGIIRSHLNKEPSALTPPPTSTSNLLRTPTSTPTSTPPPTSTSNLPRTPTPIPTSTQHVWSVRKILPIVAIFVIIALITISWLYGGGNVHLKAVGVSVTQPNENNMILTFQGGADASTCNAIAVTVTQGTNGMQVTGNFPKDGYNGGVAVGATLTLTGEFSGRDRVVAVATFTDGTKQVILDTYL